jgi:hypothetical protein
MPGVTASEKSQDFLSGGLRVMVFIAVAFWAVHNATDRGIGAVFWLAHRNDSGACWTRLHENGHV